MLHALMQGRFDAQPRAIFWTCTRCPWAAMEIDATKESR